MFYLLIKIFHFRQAFILNRETDGDDLSLLTSYCHFVFITNIEVNAHSYIMRWFSVCNITGNR